MMALAARKRQWGIFNKLLTNLILGIQKLVLNGNLGEAIDLTYQLFPGILERNSNLLFALKVRQFIEMINSSNNNAKLVSGTDNKRKTDNEFIHSDQIKSIEYINNKNVENHNIEQQKSIQLLLSVKKNNQNNDIWFD